MAAPRMPRRAKTRPQQRRASAARLAAVFCRLLLRGGFVLAPLLACRPAVAACVDPATLAHTTVGITRHFAADEQQAAAGLIGIRGTGWFLSPTAMATAGHVAVAMKLSQQNWKQVEIRDGDNKRMIAVRARSLAGADVEKIAVLELQTAFPQGRA